MCHEWEYTCASSSHTVPCTFSKDDTKDELLAFLHTHMLYIAKKDLGVKKKNYLTVYHFHGTGMIHDGCM